MPEPHATLTVSKAAEHMNVSERTVRELCSKGYLDAEKVGRSWQISAESVEQWIDKPILPPPPWFERTWVRLFVLAISVLSLFFAILADSGTRDWVYSQFFAPEPFSSECHDKARILVTSFFRTEHVKDVNSHGEIARAIESRLSELSLDEVCVSILDTPVNTEDREKAVTLGHKHDAALIIWGADTDVRIEVNFLNLKDSNSFASNVNYSTIETTQAKSIKNPDAFVQFIVHDLPTQMTYLSLFAIGQSLSHSNQIEDAIHALESATQSFENVDKVPEELELEKAYFQLGWLYQTLESPEKALAAYDRAFMIDPTSTDTLNNRGTVYQDLGDFERALEDYDLALFLDNNIARVYHNRGIAHSSLEEFDIAIDDYAHAIELDPNLVEALYGLGNAYKMTGEYDKALVEYDRVIELDPEFPFALINRGNTYLEMGRHEEAIGDYSGVIAINPGFIAAYNNRGWTYQLIGEYEKSLADFNQGIEYAPTFTSLYANRGETYYLMGKWTEALDDFRMYVELQPDSPDLERITPRIIELESMVEE